MLEKLHPLSPVDMEAVAKDGKVYSAYVDSLMLLQDLVAPLTPRRSHRRFSSGDVYKYLDKLPDIIPPGYKKVRNNIDEYARMARGLLEREITSVQDANTVATNAEEFIDELARSYTSMRNLRRAVFRIHR